MTVLSTNLSQVTENCLDVLPGDPFAANELKTLLRYLNRMYTDAFTTRVGTASGTGVVASERGNGIVQQTLLTCTNVSLTMRDTQQGGGLKVYTFPEGRILVLGATGTMTFTTTSVLASTLHASVSCRWGLGTVTQSNATLATTEQDLLPVTTFTSSATISVANTATNAALAASAQFDGTSTAKAAFLNISVPTGTDIDADATVLANGTMLVSWAYLGDY
jgi:hypothetical protein